MAEGMQQGIFVALTIEPTGGVERCIQRLPPDAGEPIEPEDAHVTVMYNYEIPAVGAEPATEEEIHGLRDDIAEQISALGIVGSILMPESNVLMPFRTWTGISIGYSPGLFDVRTTASRAVNNKFGVNLHTYRGDYHMGVAKRWDKRLRVPRQKVEFPHGLVVNGCDVSVEDVPVVPRDFARMSARQKLSAQRDFAARRRLAV
jgi:hypothetical protein